MAVSRGITALPLALAAALASGCAGHAVPVVQAADVRGRDDVGGPDAEHLLREGRDTFRFDTFGDEAFWGGTLRLHEAIEGAKPGGVGPGVSPRTALSVGLRWTSTPSTRRRGTRSRQGRWTSTRPPRPSRSSRRMRSSA